MPKLSKRQKEINEQIEFGKYYAADEAFELLKKCSNVKFKESIDVSVMLGIDPKNSEQAIRGATVLPHGTGKNVRVAVFAQGDKADDAKAAGADIVGFDDLADEIKKGKMDFDVLIATPDAMRVVGQLGQILGPRGLMPNPKVGTVSADVAGAVKNAKSGQVRYRTEKGGIIHGAIGNTDFSKEDLIGNLKALIADLKKARPASAKGVFLKKICVSSTMGPGLAIDQASLEA
jgi:large subunit ribosomal protein L1